MKTILLIILLTLSLSAFERKIPSYIIDVTTIKLIGSKTAFYVIGNEQHGTMKKNFGFAAKKTAQKYVERNGGCVVDYATYVKMTDEDIEEYVKENGIVIVVEKKTPADANVTVDTNATDADIYNKKNMQKYKF
ncbi:MAG: nitrous oxide reductase accessory protein NosL [Sulfurimonas sp.]|nr:nitrous oxide reductase accessory protein NosL [Sulfurimonas sp.]